MERTQEIDAILKDLYFSAKSQNVYLTPKVIYSYLIQRNVLPEDRDKRISNVTYDDHFQYEKKPLEKWDFFGRWIDRFKGKKNINVFCSFGWQEFCQFENGDFSHIAEEGNVNYVKMYIPLKYDHLYEGANRIFDFLAKENIVHKSKIRRKVRMDDIVIRLPDIKDVEKLQNFIDHDHYIQEGLMKGNAFAFQNNGISYAMDGRLSYNNVLSEMISRYINQIIRDPNISDERVGIEGFYQYVNSIFENYQEVDEFLDSDQRRTSVKNSNMADAYGIVRLVQKAMSTNDMRFFEEHYHWLNNEMARKDLMAAFDQQSTYHIQREDTSKEKLLQEFILTTMKKYPFGSDPNYPESSGYQYIYSYLNGNDKSVTRDNQLRDRMKQSLSREEVYKIIEDSGVPGKNINELVDNYIKKTMMNDMICSMNQRMPSCALKNLEEFMRTGRLTLITNSVGQARRLAKTFSGQEMKQFLKDMGAQNMVDYVAKYYVDENIEYTRRGSR